MLSPSRLPYLAPLDDSRRERFRPLIAQAPLFRGSPPSAIDELCRRVQVRTRPAGAILVAQDEPGEALFVIADGRVKVVVFADTGRELLLSMLGPGAVFGEMSLIDGRPRSASVIAVEPTTTLSLGRAEFLEHLRRHPQTALSVMGELCRRLRLTDETLADLAMRDVGERLERALARLARSDGERVADGVLVRRRPTQQELANMVGSCRETVCRLFASLVERGLVVHRGRGLLLSPRLLAAR